MLRSLTARAGLSRPLKAFSEAGIYAIWTARLVRMGQFCCGRRRAALPFTALARCFCWGAGGRWPGVGGFVCCWGGPRAWYAEHQGRASLAPPEAAAQRYLFEWGMYLWSFHWRNCWRLGENV